MSSNAFDTICARYSTQVLAPQGPDPLNKYELGFAGMLEQVIAAGGDTDTNASLAGQLAGASLGLHGLPDELLKRLPQADLVLDIAQTFAERVASRAQFGAQSGV